MSKADGPVKDPSFGEKLLLVWELLLNQNLSVGLE